MKTTANTTGVAMATTAMSGDDTTMTATSTSTPAATGNANSDQQLRQRRTDKGNRDYNGDYGLMKAAATAMTSRQRQCDNDGMGWRQ